MKILISSYAPFTKSGYSTQINKIVNCLHNYDDTIEFGFICWDITHNFFPFSEEPYNFDDIIQNSKKFSVMNAINFKKKDIDMYKKFKFYMPGNRENNWEKIHSFSNHFKCDKLIVYQDIWIFEKYPISQIKCEKYIYLPLHNDLLQHNLLNFRSGYNPEITTLHHLPFFNKISTFCDFGYEVMKNYGYQSTIINHIIKQEIVGDKQTLRKRIGLNDEFICLMIARNGDASDRKSFDTQFKAFSLFLETLEEREKNKCILLMHDSFRHDFDGVIDLRKISQSYKIEDKVLFTPKDVHTDIHVGELYTLSDVLLCASKSEGFGLPMVECQFYNTPVITTNCTAMTTNTFYGICTEPEKISKKIAGINSWSEPSAENIKNAIQTIYDIKYNGKENKFIQIDKSNYSEEKIKYQWIDFLDLGKEKKIEKKGKVMFDDHLKEITNILSKKKIRNIRESKKCKYNAVLIENREDIRIEPVLLNLLYFTNEEIGIQIFYNQENEDFIKNLINKYNFQNISLTKMNYAKFDREKYQDFVFSKEFYDNVQGEKILIFQTDSLLLKEFDMNYFNYDFIGAVWNEPTMKQETLSKLFKDKKPIGNGGFNIRDVQKCKKIASEILNYQRPSTKVNEDNIYSYLLQQNFNLLNTQLPSIEEAKHFSVETLHHPDPMAIHAFYEYFIGEKGEKYINHILTKHKERLCNENMIIIYRISDSSYKKEKPYYVNDKIRVLKNFLSIFKNYEVIIIADNVKEETFSQIKGIINEKNIIKTNLGNSSSFIYAVDYSIQNFNENDIVYFVEDDYIHLENSPKIIKEGLNIGDYSSGYDNPDKYIDHKKGGPNPFIYAGGEDTKVLKTESSHWKITNSFCMTFAVKNKTLKEDYNIIIKHCHPERKNIRSIFGSSVPDDFPMFQELTKKKRKIVSCIPSVSTHGETQYLAPFIDWEKEFLKQ